MEATRGERLPVNERDRHVCVLLGGESDGGMIDASELATRKLGIWKRLLPLTTQRDDKAQEKLTSVSPIKCYDFIFWAQNISIINPHEAHMIQRPNCPVKVFLLRGGKIKESGMLGYERFFHVLRTNTNQYTMCHNISVFSLVLQHMAYRIVF